MKYNQLNLFNIIEESNSKTSNDIELKKPHIFTDFPFDDIYEISRKEASRKKPIFFIHKYFARRTTSTFRLIMLTTLKENFHHWKEYYDSYKTTNNLVILDPFMGGGTTIFEALRLDAKVIGNDLQPLSKFVTTAEVKSIDESKLMESLDILDERIGHEIKDSYTTECPCCSKNADVMYNFHVKTAEIKSKKHYLFSNYIIASSKSNYTLICPNCFDVFEHDFSKGSATCPCCKNEIGNPNNGVVKNGKLSIDDEKLLLRDLPKESGYPLNSELIAQEYYCPHCNSKGYKKVQISDIKKYREAQKEYDETFDSLKVPKVRIPDGYNTNQIIRHNYEYFYELFNKRQRLYLSKLLEEIDKLEDKESQFWLLLAFSGMLEMNNMFCRYQHNANKISNIFFNHAYVPITMPVENNIWGTKFGTGSFIKTINKIIRGKQFNQNVFDIYVNPNGKSEKVFNGDKVLTQPVSNYNELNINKPLITSQDSRNLDFLPNKSVNLVITDPPFGDQVMYSELIDFFHSWLYLSVVGKNLGFITELTPKTEEIIVNKNQNKTFSTYSNGLSAVFSECNRVLKDDGLLIFTFHDSKLESWNAMFKSIYSSKFKIIKTYPIHSETRTGAHTSSKNSIVFDIIIICKKEISEDKSYSKEDSIKYSIKETNKIINRLEAVNAELTIKDIENIFIGKYLESIPSLNSENNHLYEEVYIDIVEIVKQLDEILSFNTIVSKRTGWWSEKMGKIFHDNLLNNLK